MSKAVCVVEAGYGIEPKEGMPQQPELKSSVLPENPADPPAPFSDHPRAPHRIPHWLQRAELFVRVLLRMYIGLAICYAPWSPSLWDQNPVFTYFPTLSIIAMNGAVRGIITGLGLLNLWIAFRDAIHHGEG